MVMASLRRSGPRDAQRSLRGPIHPAPDFGRGRGTWQRLLLRGDLRAMPSPDRPTHRGHVAPRGRVVGRKRLRRGPLWRGGGEVAGPARSDQAVVRFDALETHVPEHRLLILDGPGV